MNAATLIYILKQAPPDAEVAFVYDGHFRGDINYVYSYAGEIRLTAQSSNVRGELIARADSVEAPSS